MGRARSQYLERVAHAVRSGEIVLLNTDLIAALASEYRTTPREIKRARASG